MKTSNYIPAFLFLCGAALGILLYREFRKEPTSQPQQLTLEQILSIRELHLVKHTYNDLFYLHKKNNPAKAIRAIVQVPVTITAYLNLKDIEVISHGDSVQQIILPKATLSDPVYHVNNIIIRETRSFQIHAGKDLYPLVGSYLGTMIDSRMDTTRHMAEINRILPILRRVSASGLCERNRMITARVPETGDRRREMINQIHLFVTHSLINSLFKKEACKF